MAQTFTPKQYAAIASIMNTAKAEAGYAFDPITQRDTFRAIEDHLSLAFAKDNPKFDLIKWRKALGRTDIGTAVQSN
jgi:hypothetical protein